MPITLNPLNGHLDRQRTIYVSSHTVELFLRGGSVVLRSPQAEQKVPLSGLRRVVILGKPNMGVAILCKFMRHGIAVDWLDIFGRPLGVLVPLGNPSGHVRLAQERFAASREGLALGRRIIAAKMENIALLMLRRKALPRAWYALRRSLETADTADTIRGIEGAAARMFFACFGEWCPRYPWQGRKSYPAPDPVNMLLSLGYGLLRNRLASTLHHHGADPRLGFFHQTRGTHWALASDLMEDIRFIVDSTVLKLARSEKISPDDFALRNGRCVTAKRSAFKTVMETFENMFCRPWARMEMTPQGPAIRHDTLNDWIDIAAGSFCRHVLNRGIHEPFRRKIWNTVW